MWGQPPSAVLRAKLDSIRTLSRLRKETFQVARAMHYAKDEYLGIIELIEKQVFGKS